MNYIIHYFHLLVLVLIWTPHVFMQRTTLEAHSIGQQQVCDPRSWQNCTTPFYFDIGVAPSFLGISLDIIGRSIILDTVSGICNWVSDGKLNVMLENSKIWWLSLRLHPSSIPTFYMSSIAYYLNTSCSIHDGFSLQKTEFPLSI